jgi:hypothetical protein
MSKKSSRATRSQQNVKRSTSARPLVATEEKPEVSEKVSMPVTFEKEETPLVIASPTIAPVRSSTPVTRPVSKPIPRRFIKPANTVNQQLDREEEYRFIKSDLMLVFILTVLVIVVLVILTFVIGR